MTTVAAFRRLVLDGAPVTTVAEELHMSSNAVLVAKSKFLKRLRNELAGLSSLDD